MLIEQLGTKLKEHQQRLLASENEKMNLQKDVQALRLNLQVKLDACIKNVEFYLHYERACAPFVIAKHAPAPECQPLATYFLVACVTMLFQSI